MRKAAAAILAVITLWMAPSAWAVVSGTLADPTTGDHVVALLEVGKEDGRAGQFCTGTLLDAQWVLTAAHCTFDLAPGQVQVGVGKEFLAEITPAERYTVDRIVQYPLYDPAKWGHDLALVHLAVPVPATIHPAPERYQRGPRMTYATSAWVSGWGATEREPNGSVDLETGQISVSTPAQCRAIGAPWGTVCGTTPFSSQPAACWGDSGGPLESGGILIGVVSFGPSGCDNSTPTAYTHVGSYSTWIDYVRRGGNPSISLPEVSAIRIRQIPGTTWTTLTVRWCQTGGIGHHVHAVFRVAHVGDSEGWHLHESHDAKVRTRCVSHTTEHRENHRRGQRLVAFAQVRDDTTGLNYWSTYPTRFRIR